MEQSLMFLNTYLNNGDTVVCATSGGADSMTLLYLLILFRKKININIICAHVNHSLREESVEEYEFVKKYCETNKIIFEGTTFNDYSKGNIEAQAHKMRYNFFEEIVDKYSAKYLLTAHHGDDLIETILMKLTRGSSLDGYIGFDIEKDMNNYKILRPLVFYTKEEIQNYADENKMEYRVDKTNFSDKYTRNRYRMNVLPLLKKENKNIHLKYLKFSKMLKDNNDYINRTVDKEYENVYKNGFILIDKLIELDEFIINKIIYKFLVSIYNDKINLVETKNINNILSLIKNNRPNIELNLPNNVIIQKSYNNLSIKNKDLNCSYKYEIKDKVRVPYGEIKLLNNTTLTNNYVCHLNSNDLKLPLYVRNKKDGDSIILLGLNKSKKIKDIFINEKINAEKRKNYPVVVDSNDNVIWVPGLKKSKYDTIKTGKYDIILWYDKEENNE